jgi:TusA-related sulfurtransferase
MHLKKKKANCKKEIHEIDVRNLEMPLPMLTILQELESLKENEVLYVHHKKIPQYLLPELEERKFKTWITEINSENVKLLIHK